MRQAPTSKVAGSTGCDSALLTPLTLPVSFASRLEGRLMNFEWRRRSMSGSVCEFESYIHRSGCTVPYPTLRTRRSCFTAASALPRHNRTKTGRTGPKKGMLKFRLTGRLSLDSYFFNRLDRNSRRKEQQGEAQIV